MRMFPSLRIAPIWSGVGRWTLGGSLAFVCVSVAFNAVLFVGMERAVMVRAMISAVAIPLLLVTPALFYFSLRLQGLSRSNQRLGVAARTDALTGCLNRGAFLQRLDTFLRSKKRVSHGALLMLDADNFKAINDQWGHEAGDEALAIISRAIRSVLRGSDVVGRLGGEEFGVFLPHADAGAAEHIAERIRRSVNLAAFAPDGHLRPLSVSIGGAAFCGDAHSAPLLRLADQRLYAAKGAGRNRVHVAPCPPLHQVARSYAGHGTLADAAAS